MMWPGTGAHPNTLENDPAASAAEMSKCLRDIVSRGFNTRFCQQRAAGDVWAELAHTSFVSSPKQQTLLVITKGTSFLVLLGKGAYFHENLCQQSCNLRGMKRNQVADELPGFTESMPRYLANGPLIGFPRVMLTQWLGCPAASFVREHGMQGGGPFLIEGSGEKKSRIALVKCFQRLLQRLRVDLAKERPFRGAFPVGELLAELGVAERVLVCVRSACLYIQRSVPN